MILIDTSVWINYFNGADGQECEILDQALLDSTAAIGDIIFLEILQGFKHDKDYKNAKKELSLLDHYELFGQHMIEKCANNYRALRKKGITIRSTNDVIIATYCIENKLPLLFADRDFLPFCEHLNLKPASPKT